MKTGEFLKESIHLKNFRDIEIKSLHLDSREVTKGGLFFAVKGKESDGNNFIKSALDQGASMVISDSSNTGIEDVIHQKELKKNIGIFASRFYGNPSSRLKTICVTGTNGKTTCVESFAAMSNLLNRKCAFMSTINYSTDGINLKASQLTTPDPIRLQKNMKDALDDNAVYLSMEASSHGLDQNRLNGVDIDYAILTSFSHDHLDYHLDLENYKSSKEKLFLDLNPKKNVICIDSSFGKELYNKVKEINPYTYSVSIKQEADFQASFEDIKDGLNVTLCGLDNKFNFDLTTVSRYLASNVICSIAVLMLENFDPDSIKSLTRKIDFPLGRLQKIEKGNISIYIDYAHTPEALKNTLKEIKRFHNDDLWCLFGCGGDRDKEKRPLMGGAAEKYSDKVILTNDNPRTEDENKIIRDILSGINNKDKIIIQSDRRQAIEIAISGLQNKNGGILLIAGKGHETHQEINGRFFEFNDIDIVKSL